MRVLLGAPDDAEVTSYCENEETGTTYTPESWSTVTVAAAGLSFTTEGSDALPRMLRFLEHVDAENPRITALRALGRELPGITGES